MQISGLLFLPLSHSGNPHTFTSPNFWRVVYSSEGGRIQKSLSDDIPLDFRTKDAIITRTSEFGSLVTTGGRSTQTSTTFIEMMVGFIAVEMD